MIYLMRHGQDDSAYLGGWSNIGLTAEGRIQAEIACDKLKNQNIRHIFSSDLQRARETAEIVSDKLNLNINFIQGFREINNGDLAGLSKEEARRKFKGIYYSALNWEQKYPNGESPKMFYERITDTWKKFKEDVGLLKGNILLVTHGGVINAVLCYENGVKYTNEHTEYHVGYAETVSCEEKKQCKK